MARPLPVQELIPELEFWIKHPTDPSLRKLLRKTVTTLNAFVELVGEVDQIEPKEALTPLPNLQERISTSE